MIREVLRLLFGTSNKDVLTVQDILGFDDIVDNMIMIDKQTFIAIFECSKVNLKWRDDKEVEEIIQSFKETVHQLKFPSQWQRVTRVLDLDKYLGNIHQKSERTENQIKKRFLPIYKKHIEQQINKERLMSSKIYLAVGYKIGQQNTDINKSTVNFLKSLIMPTRNYFKTMNQEEKIQEVSMIFTALEDDISGSLRKVGSKARRLQDEELNQLLYESYRKDLALIQRYGNHPVNGIPIRVGETDA
jgi:hypothetical protein